MREKALNYIGLMRKANAIQIGENDTGAAVKTNKAKLVLLASDASDNAIKRAEGFVFDRNVTLITVPFSKEEISDKVGKTGCSMAAVCDIGFADALMKCLVQLDAGQHSEAAELIEIEMQKNARKIHEKNTRTGKRRKN